MPVGLHLIVDAECTRGLNDARTVGSFLRESARLAEMQILEEPKVFELPTDAPTGPGITAFVVLVTSHASIHTFVQTNRISFDLYSCKCFDPDSILKLFDETFGVTRYLQHDEIERAEMMDDG